MELNILEVLGEDEVGLEMQLVPTGCDNSTAPLKIPEITNQAEVVYNADWGP